LRPQVILLFVLENSMETTRSLKVNIGSHAKRVDGWINVDGLDLPEVDVIFDYNNLKYGNSPFDDSEVDEIMAIEFLEHLSFHITHLFLRDCYRILKPDGTIKIQVPAIDKMCEFFIKGHVCVCVPHKEKKGEKSQAKKGCTRCNGKGLINETRWRIAFAGAQKHPFDTHLNHFTAEILKHDLKTAGFKDIEVKHTHNDWKLEANATKPSII